MVPRIVKDNGRDRTIPLAVAFCGCPHPELARRKHAAFKRFDDPVVHVFVKE
jgi:hypothetical protein